MRYLGEKAILIQFFLLETNTYLDFFSYYECELKSASLAQFKWIRIFYNNRDSHARSQNTGYSGIKNKRIINRDDYL